MPITIAEHFPRPIIAERLRWLRDAGVAVGTVLDVGVQGGTSFLLDCYGDAPHLLFEPVDAYFPTIAKRYAKTAHTLVHAAMSDTDGEAWQLGYSRDGSGRITHSQISIEPVPAGSQPDLVECKPVRRLRLDTAMAEHPSVGPFLLKVDVDGHEIPILKGAPQTLAQSSIVIVEATMKSIQPKLELMHKAGFEFMDMVDLCYYHGLLSQCDLIFVHSTWVARCPDLRPWQTKPFAWTAWAPLSANPIFGTPRESP